MSEKSVHPTRQAVRARVGEGNGIAGNRIRLHSNFDRSGIANFHGGIEMSTKPDDF